MESLENPFLNLEKIIDEVNLISNDHLIIVMFMVNLHQKKWR